ncbi:MAG: hypothetical protein WCK47_12940 [bacterium]
MSINGNESERRTCVLCGGTVFDGQTKCSYCGTVLESSPPAQAAPGPAESSAESTFDKFGSALVAIPIAGVIVLWLWIARLTLLQSPGIKLFMVALVTFIACAAVAATEASRLGMGPTEGAQHPTKEPGPGLWFILITVLWFVAYPLYMILRVNYGAKDLRKAAIAVVVVFALSLAYLSGHFISSDIRAEKNVSNPAERENFLKRY